MVDVIHSSGFFTRGFQRSFPVHFCLPSIHSLPAHSPPPLSGHYSLSTPFSVHFCLFTFLVFISLSVHSILSSALYVQFVRFLLSLFTSLSLSFSVQPSVHFCVLISPIVHFSVCSLLSLFASMYVHFFTGSLVCLFTSLFVHFFLFSPLPVHFSLFTPLSVHFFMFTAFCSLLSVQLSLFIYFSVLF